MPNPHERFHRSREVVALTDTLWLHLTDAERRSPRLADELRTWNNAQRDALAEAAGVRTPSSTTWHAFVDRVEVLVERERAEAGV